MSESSVVLAPEPLRLSAKDLPQFAETAASVAAAAARLRGECVVEPKFDGWRLLVEVREDGVRVYSRNGIQYTGQLPHVEAEIAERFEPGTWLDGEAVCLSMADGLVSVEWGVVQSVMTTTTRRHPATERVSFMAFDLIAHAGVDARGTRFRVRREMLERLFADGGFRHVALAPQFPIDAFGAPDDAHGVFLAQGFEGTVIKSLDATYRSGTRGTGWARVKPEHRMDGVVMDSEPGKGGFTGLVGALIFGQHDADGSLVRRGQCSGMTLTQRRRFTADAQGMIERGDVIEVAYTELQPSGALRHARFKRLRPDLRGAPVPIHDER